MPSNRYGQRQKVFGKTKDEHICIYMFLDEAMARDDKLTEQKAKTVRKDDCLIRSSVFFKENASNSCNYG